MVSRSLRAASSCGRIALVVAKGRQQIGGTPDLPRNGPYLPEGLQTITDVLGCDGVGLLGAIELDLRLPRGSTVDLLLDMVETTIAVLVQNPRLLRIGLMHAGPAAVWVAQPCIPQEIVRSYHLIGQVDRIL